MSYRSQPLNQALDHDLVQTDIKSTCFSRLCKFEFSRYCVWDLVTLSTTTTITTMPRSSSPGDPLRTPHHHQDKQAASFLT